MKGVGPGTVLGGRYTVHRRLAQDRGTERWIADDTTLGRRVVVLVVPVEDHRSAAFLDAARRAGSVAHAVLVRILDVGQDDEVAWVVEEELDDARSLAQLVTEGGIPGDEVRRITGEVASALESARQRGMHHLDLTPEDVLRSPDGEVRLRGLEVASVRAGEDGLDPEDAARQDAVGVVALAYAGLTGLWPLGAGAGELSAAPRVPGGVAAPSEIAAGVPRDLDAICRLTLNDDQGPTSPGDYARQVAPWPTRQVVGRPVTPSRVVPPAARSAAPAEVEDVEAPADEAARTDAVRTEAARTAAIPAAAIPAADPRRRDGGRRRHRRDRRPARRPEHRSPGAGTTRHTPGPRSGRARDAPTRGRAGVALRRLPRRRARPDDAPDDVASWDPAGSDEAPAPDDDETSGGLGRRMSALAHPRRGDGSTEHAGAAAAAGAAGSAVGEAFGQVGSRVSRYARRAVDKVTELSPDTRPGDGLADLDAPAPMVPAEPLTRDESKLALGIVAAFLVLALVIGIYGLSKIGSNTDLGLETPAGGTGTPTASAAPSGSASDATSSGGAPEPLAILKVEAYDPQGDGAENNKLTPKTYDGDTSTGWNSENYRTDAFGGLKKGLGLIVDLGPNKKPQNVRLVIPKSVDLEVYVGPDADLEGATKVGAKTDAQGTVDFPVPDDVTGQYIIVWYTGLHADDQGKRRAWLNEVVVTG